MSLQSLNIQQVGAQSTTANQTVSENDIKLQIRNKKNSQLSPSTTYSCKICLAEVEVTGTNYSGLISPCACTGSMKFVHNQCLVEWLNTIVTQNLQNGLNTTKICCEICKVDYMYETKEKYTWVSSQEMLERIKLNWGIFLLGVVFILGAFAGCIALGVMIGTKKFNFSDNSTEKTMFFILIALLVLVFIFWSVRIVYLFFVKTLIFIKNILGRQSVDQSQNQLFVNPENSNNISVS